MLKPSFKTGEFWIYVAFGLVVIYLKKHDIQLQELKETGESFVKAMGGMDTLEVLAPAILFGTKRIIQKIIHDYYIMRIKIAAIQQESKTCKDK